MLDIRSDDSPARDVQLDGALRPRVLPRWIRREEHRNESVHLNPHLMVVVKWMMIRDAEYSDKEDNEFDNDDAGDSEVDDHDWCWS